MFSSRLDWRTPPNRFSRLIDEKRRAGCRLIDLTESNPTQAGLDLPDPLPALLEPAARRYEPHPRGLRQTRESVAAYYGARGEVVDPERIWITSSTSEAYSLLLKLLAEPGEEILVPRPSYPLLDFLAALDGVQIASYRLSRGGSGWVIDESSLRAALTPETRAIVAVSPNNPTGNYLHERDREILLDVCRRHELALIVDEVFFDYGAGGASVVSQGDSLCFVLSGLSKILALPQMKLGWIAASGPADLLADASGYLDIIADTYLSPNTPVQLAAPIWLERREEVQGRILERVRRNLGAMESRRGDVPWEMVPVEGGWYAVLESPAWAAAEEEIVEELVELDEVIVHPGFFFDFPTGGYFVVSLLPPPEDFDEGLHRLARRLAR